ncbi:methionine aminopeptidase 1D, mitochondrial [Leptopilina heterotoma]|uniref:methionine aminopeptidase 1D, mitochondrial n=1 Tax=Leptopilina heterotoma TaxID=63436 RepID=UPI001CA7E8D5|nr:methionine aminopeptidase 1D, mitochondrial [Leptopilina heterotoma]
MLQRNFQKVSLQRRNLFDFFQSSKKSPKLGPNEKNNSFGKYDIVEPWTVSERRTVPSYIPKPSYAQSSIPRESPKFEEVKDENQIEAMRHSCLLAKRILNQIHALIKPGETTDSIDGKVHELIIYNTAYPSPLNYRGYPKSICTSINNVACHGIPDSRPLKNGDILNVDITVFLNGYHGDCSTMFQVGSVDSEGKRLISATEICLMEAIKICKPNENFKNIGSVIQETAEKQGFGIIPAFAGHGIGTYFHGPPDIFHCLNEVEGQMQPGMTFTIEPVLTQGGPEIEILEDGWTAVTTDNARTAQCEHTILITETGCDILTL